MNDLSVKYFNSAMAGAPQVSNNWGDLVTMLDACLINGFNLSGIDSLIQSEGLATATITTGHAYQPGQILRIAGATQAEYNGEVRVISTTATQFTFAITGNPVSPATTSSSISAVVAPLNWEAPFTATNKRAYRSRHPESPGNLLLIDDEIKANEYATTWAKWANVGIVEGMSDIDTIVGSQAPYDASRPTQNWQQREANHWGWYKWYHAQQAGYENYGDGGGGDRNWILIGDDRLFYLFITNRKDYSWYGRNFYCFGDIESFKPGDRYHTVLCADDRYWSINNSYISYPGQYNGYGLTHTLNWSGKAMLRNHTQVGNYIRWGVTSLNTSNGQLVCGRGNLPFPNGADYSLWLMPTYVRQEDGHMRGMMPGMHWMHQNRPYSDQTIIENVVGQPDKRFVLVRTQYSSETEGAQVAFGISGPWR